MNQPRMTPGEVGKLLGLMALADNRKPPDEDDVEGRNAVIGFWLEMIGDLTYADCAQAVQAHYRETRDWIMPADIRRRVRATRAERIKKSVVDDPPAELADNPPAFQAALQANIRRAGDGHALPVTSAFRALAAPVMRTNGPPASLRAAFGELRQILGPARRRAIESPQAIARRQAAESRRQPRRSEP